MNVRVKWIGAPFSKNTVKLSFIQLLSSQSEIQDHGTQERSDVKVEEDVKNWCV